jgi:hypothetical protein
VLERHAKRQAVTVKLYAVGQKIAARALTDRRVAMVDRMNTDRHGGVTYGPPTKEEQLLMEAYWTDRFIEIFGAEDVPDDYARIRNHKPESEKNLPYWLQELVPPPF